MEISKGLWDVYVGLYGFSGFKGSCCWFLEGSTRRSGVSMGVYRHVDGFRFPQV